MKHKQLGFTIVELLIVIVVIGILAAISIVAYNNIQKSAHDNIVKQDLANFRKGMEMVRAELGRYPRSTEFPSSLKITRNSYSTAYNHVNYVTDPAGTVYALAVMSKSGQAFRLTNSSDVTEVSLSNLGAHPTAQSVGLTWADPNSRRQGYQTATGWATDWSFVQP